MIEFDINEEVGIEAARIFDVVSKVDVLLASVHAENFLNQQSTGRFRLLAIAAFNQAVEGCVEAKLIRLSQDRCAIVLELASPLSSQWLSMVDNCPEINCQWSEPCLYASAI